MKQYIYICTFLMLPIQLFAQVVAVQTERPLEIFLCHNNPFTIVVEGCEPDAISLTTDNGVISQDKNARKSDYTIEPQHLGRAKVFVHKELKGRRDQEIDSLDFRVRELILSGPYFSNAKRNGPLDKAEVLRGLAITARVDLAYYNWFARIDSFTAVVLREGNVIFRRPTAGGRIDDTTKTFFRELKNSDLLIFNNITTKDCTGRVRKLEALEYTIINDDKPLRRIDPISGEEME